MRLCIIKSFVFLELLSLIFLFHSLGVGNLQVRRRALFSKLYGYEKQNRFGFSIDYSEEGEFMGLSGPELVHVDREGRLYIWDVMYKRLWRPGGGVLKIFDKTGRLLKMYEKVSGGVVFSVPPYMWIGRPFGIRVFKDGLLKVDWQKRIREGESEELMEVLKMFFKDYRTCERLRFKPEGYLVADKFWLEGGKVVVAEVYDGRRILRIRFSNDGEKYLGSEVLNFEKGVVYGVDNKKWKLRFYEWGERKGEGLVVKGWLCEVSEVKGKTKYTLIHDQEKGKSFLPSRLLKSLSRGSLPYPWRWFLDKKGRLYLILSGYGQASFKKQFWIEGKRFKLNYKQKDEPMVSYVVIEGGEVVSWHDWVPDFLNPSIFGWIQPSYEGNGFYEMEWASKGALVIFHEFP